ncbi:hypothetical protein [Piscinibacter sakaiensis]|uniref:hypothetical protein n=1 Tax=Piscinibacter sakaiensis TaxID=1547922 RepID=UPI003AABFDE6
MLAGFVPGERHVIAQRLEQIRKLGHEQRDSVMVHGIINLSAPVFDHSGVVAAITMGFMGQANPRTTVVEALQHVKQGAHELSVLLGGEIRKPEE